MPRPVRPWFRFYVEAIHDPKITSLSLAHRWLWIVVLSAARASPTSGVLLVADGVPMDRKHLAKLAGISTAQVDAGIREFKKLGMVGHEGDAWAVTNWKERQYESDDITARTRRSKEQRRNVPKLTLEQGSGVLGTPPENREQRTDKTPPTPPAAENLVERVLAQAAQRIVETTPNVTSPRGLFHVSRERLRDEFGVWIAEHASEPLERLVDHVVPPAKIPKPAPNLHLMFHPTACVCQGRGTDRTCNRAETA